MRSLRVGASLQQKLYHRGISGAARIEQGCDAVIIRDVCLCSRSDESARHLDVGIVYSPKKRSGSIPGGSVYVSMRRNKFSNRREIAAFYSFCNCAVTGASNDANKQHS